eukprot:403505_1
MARPRPSASMRSRDKRANTTSPNSKPIAIVLVHSTSPESKEPLSPQNELMQDLTLAPTRSSAAKKDDILNILNPRLNRIQQSLTMRKSMLDQELNEITEFIANTSNDISTDRLNPSSPQDTRTAPTSLSMVGIRDPKSLLYHRQLKNSINKQHHRARTQLEHSGNAKPQQDTAPRNKLSINNKYNHLRSASS